MQLVTLVQHTLDDSAVLAGEAVVDVEKPHLRPIRDPGEPGVDLRDGGHDRQVVVARKDGRQDDRRVRRLLTAEIDDRLHTPHDLGDRCLIAGLRAHVVGAGQQDDHLGIDAIELAVLEPPQDVLRAVRAPAEVGRIPAVEVLLPVGDEVGVVGRAPSAHDRIALEIDVDSPLLRLLKKLGVRRHRILIGSWGRLIGTYIIEQ